MNKLIKFIFFLSLLLFSVVGSITPSVTCKAEGKDILKFFMSIYDDGSTLCGFNFIYKGDTLFVSEPIEINKNLDFENAIYYSNINDFRNRLDSLKEDPALYSYFVYGKEHPHFDETNCKYEIFIYNISGKDYYDNKDIVYSINELKRRYIEINPVKIKSNFKSQMTINGLIDDSKYIILRFEDTETTEYTFLSEVSKLTREPSSIAYIDVSAYYLYWLLDDFTCMKQLLAIDKISDMVEYDFTNSVDYSYINNADNSVYFYFDNFKQFNTGNCKKIRIPKYSHCIEENSTTGNESTTQFCKTNHTYISIPHKFIININQYNIKDKVYKNKEVVMYNNGPNGNAVLNESLYKLPNVNSTSEYYTFEGYEIVSDSLNIKTSLSDYIINPDKEFLFYSDSYEIPQITVKEIFKPIDVKVNIDCSNYNFDINTPSVIWNIDKEENFTDDYTQLLPNSSAKGYKFVGYYTDLSTNSDGSISFSNKNKITSLKSIIDIKNDKSITIYPGFVKDSSISEGKTFTISFKDNLFPSISIKEGEALTNLPTPIIENSTFTGWNTEDGTSIDNGYIPTSDIILYPTFVENSSNAQNKNIEAIENAKTEAETIKKIAEDAEKLFDNNLYSDEDKAKVSKAKEELDKSISDISNIADSATEDEISEKINVVKELANKLNTLIKEIGKNIKEAKIDTTPAPKSNDVSSQTTNPSSIEGDSTKAPVSSTITPVIDYTKQISEAKELQVKKVKVKAAKKKLTVSFKKVKDASYQIQVSTSKKFVKKTTKFITTDKIKASIKKLKNKKNYFVRVRTIKVINGNKVYGKWSPVKKVKTK